MPNDSSIRRLRRQQQKILGAHRGEKARLARQVNVPLATLCGWFAGRFESKRIERAVAARVRALKARSERRAAA